MSDLNKPKKKLTPEEKKKRRRKVMFNRAIFASICILLIAVIIYIVYLFISFLSSVFGWNDPAKYVISGESTTASESIIDTQDTTTSKDKMNPYENILICLDAGHGGHDSGTQDLHGNKESTEVLEMTLLLKEKLENLGIKVILTRDSDEYISLSDRCRIANDANATLFLSIHRNFYEPDASVCGVEAWINSSCPKEDYAITEKILESITEVEVTNNRGIRHGTRDDNYEEDYAINNLSNMPSLILEMGYMSNETDNQLFHDNMEDYCVAIANAIANWYLNQPG